MTKQELDALCSAWPGVSTDIKWEFDLVYSVGGKMFAVTGLAGDAVGSLSFKVPDEVFLAITDQPGVRPAPYLARAKWVCVEQAGACDRRWLGQRLRESYELVRAKLPKKVRVTLGN